MMKAAILLATALAAGGVPKEPSGLDARDLDPALVLPPPPANGSAQALAELAELHAVERTRTEAQTAAAALDGETKNASIFAEVLGPRFDLARLPATARLMAIVRATGKDAADRGKDAFARQRPYVVDPTLNSCKLGNDPKSSYPSGHTTMAFSMGGVLARLVPTRAPEILARAARYGESRIVCEQHFRSDVTAGETLGTVIAERLMAKPAFVAAFTASRDELARAGIR